MTWRAFTTVLVGDVRCSLINTRPPGMGTVWFGPPLTGMDTPLIARFSMFETPEPAAPRTARACAEIKSAPILVPAPVMARAASDAQEPIRSGPPIVGP